MLLRKLLVPVLLLLALLAGLLLGGVVEARPSRMIILSVGQGDCAVLQSDGYTVLIDAGPATAKYDAGKRLIAPKLRKLGVTRIDLMLISHPDVDHVGGLKALVQQFPVGTFVIPSCFARHPVMRELGLSGSRVFWLEEAATVQLGRFKLQLQAPFRGFVENDNEGSMFVRMAAGKASAVFTGDAGIEVERMMSGRLPDWSAQILHAGHHGSRTSTGSEWLSLVRPETVVISCGRNNRYGHPHPSVLKAVKGAGARVLRTDLDGDLEFRIEESGFQRVR